MQKLRILVVFFVSAIAFLMPSVAEASTFTFGGSGSTFNSSAAFDGNVTTYATIPADGLQSRVMIYSGFSVGDTMYWYKGGAWGVEIVVKNSSGAVLYSGYGSQNVNAAAASAGLPAPASGSTTDSIVLPTGAFEVDFGIPNTQPGNGYLYEVYDVSGPQPPPQVTGISGSAGNGSATLSWSAAANATSYDVYQDGTKVATGITSTNYTVTGLANWTSYSFTVSAVNSTGEGPQSASVEVTPSSPIVGPPTNVSSYNITSTSATLSWNAVTGAKTYTVYNDYTGVAIASGLTGTTYDWTGLTSSTNYLVSISATNVTEGPRSNSISIKTLAPPTIASPTNIQASGTPGGPGTLSWTPGSGTPSGTTYTIYKDGNFIGTTSSTSYSLTSYSPTAVYGVTAAATGYTPSSVTSLSVISSLQAPFTVTDLIVNVMDFLESFGGFILLSLLFLVAPILVAFLRSSMRERQGKMRIEGVTVDSVITSTEDARGLKGESYDYDIPKATQSNLRARNYDFSFKDKE